MHPSGRAHPPKGRSQTPSLIFKNGRIFLLVPSRRRHHARRRGTPKAGRVQGGEGPPRVLSCVLRRGIGIGPGASTYHHHHPSSLCPLFRCAESERGQVTVRVRDGKRTTHEGIKVEFVGNIGTFFFILEFERFGLPSHGLIVARNVTQSYSTTAATTTSSFPSRKSWLLRASYGRLRRSTFYSRMLRSSMRVIWVSMSSCGALTLTLTLTLPATSLLFLILST